MKLLIKQNNFWMVHIPVKNESSVAIKKTLEGSNNTRNNYFNLDSFLKATFMQQLFCVKFASYAQGIY